MADPYSMLALLDSSCFSILYPLYHNPDVMIHQQLPYPSPVQQHHAPPLKCITPYCVGPTGQREILLKAIGIPQPLRAALAQAAQGELAIKHGSPLPSNSSFISRMYSAQIPNQSFPADWLVCALQKELGSKTLEADNYFINYLFPSEHSPFGVSDQVIHNGKPVMWNEAEHCFCDMLSTFRENDLAVWLNDIGTIMGQVFGREILHLWSHRSCDTPPISSPIKHKPDLILLDKKYYKELQDPN
ncbi:hypothetical protein BYT27DRAFT_7314312 [Phlegmacium glaucopus]|nr:hypothetical protein BYT27DRAFT_7314312 [Phlegmacium glaucopus]